MIGLEDVGGAHYHVFNPGELEHLEAYGDLVDESVLGIVKDKVTKEQMLQVMPSKYGVIHSTTTLPLLSTRLIMAKAKSNPATKPTPNFFLLTNKEEFLEFYGWKNAHCWDPESDWKCRRIHVFLRPVREVTSSALLRKKSKTGLPINYTDHRDVMPTDPSKDTCPSESIVETKESLA